MCHTQTLAQTVAGHSGAGCLPDAHLHRVASLLEPAIIIADTCPDTRDQTMLHVLCIVITWSKRTRGSSQLQAG